MNTASSPAFLVASLALGLVSLALAAYNLWAINRLNRLKKTFFTGSNGADLEDTINTMAAQLANLKDEQLVIEHNVTTLHHNFGFAVQKIGMIRFNPFKDGGGNLSFSLALLNGHNTGVVVTSMHGREQNRIYTKRITEGASEVTLTEEEQEAIRLANTP